MNGSLYSPFETDIQISKRNLKYMRDTYNPEFEVLVMCLKDYSFQDTLIHEKGKIYCLNIVALTDKQYEGYYQDLFKYEAEQRNKKWSKLNKNNDRA